MVFVEVRGCADEIFEAVRTALSRPIWVAYKRSVQLGMGVKRGPVGDD
jgi:hypothetical protein